MSIKTGILYFSLIIISCSSPSTEEPSKAQQIIDASIAAHGFDNLTNKKITFDFRGREYAVERFPDSYNYYRIWQDSLGLVTDKLVNSTNFSRNINGQLLQIEEEWAQKYSRSVNSVLYFFQLPFGLNDPAVNKNFIGEIQLEGETYHLINVTFQQEGGGEDFEDQFLYWINQQTNLVDYIAYNYITDGGGVRLRKAINRRTIEGLVFQDYINFKPDDKSTPLDQLDDLYIEGKLIELSRIESENIKVLSL